MRNQLLRDADWAGMAHGVEIRVPFVDVALLRALAPMIASSNPPTKARLVAAIGPPLSDDIATRRKTGFSVPVREWLRAEVPHVSKERGLRGWARVAARFKGGRRFLSFVTDAYGGHGGIALYNRDLCRRCAAFRDARASWRSRGRCRMFPSRCPRSSSTSIRRRAESFVISRPAFRVLRGDRSHDLVVCGHINLLPLAWLASRFLEVPLVLFIYGIDAWKPTRSVLANSSSARSNGSSRSARSRRESSTPGCRRKRSTCACCRTRFIRVVRPRRASQALLERYGLQGKTVLMTLGRLVSVERYKGFDEALEVLPELAAQLPNVAYMVVGDGTDRARLEEKARALGVADRVVFTGNVQESEKADHYRLADVYVMPSQGEGFGFVLLEAMACGIPVIASKVDGGREAVRDGALGRMVEPATRTN
jgi:glycosyltransferase involved in cell wall biosynthesis